MRTHARLFYVAEVSWRWDELHSAFFETIHGQKKHLVEEGEIRQLIDVFGLPGGRFVHEDMDSFRVQGEGPTSRTTSAVLWGSRESHKSLLLVVIV